jgi:hypothetical protein
VLNHYDMIKLDVEGSEGAIVLSSGFKPSASVIAMEYHSEDLRDLIVHRLCDRGWYLVDGQVTKYNLGTLVFYSKEYGDRVKTYLKEKKNAA